MILEGEPDFLLAAVHPHPSPTAVIGIVSGSWSPAFVERFPMECVVGVWSDQDPAGERYALQVFNSLRARCHPRRWRLRRASKPSEAA